MSNPGISYWVPHKDWTHVLFLLTHDGDPPLWLWVHSGPCWWGRVSWWRPLMPRRWTCLRSRSSTGCAAASPQPNPRGPLGASPPAAPAGRGRWPRGWRHCREKVERRWRGGGVFGDEEGGGGEVMIWSEPDIIAQSMCSGGMWTAWWGTIFP